MANGKVATNSSRLTWTSRENANVPQLFQHKCRQGLSLTTLGTPSHPCMGNVPGVWAANGHSWGIHSPLMRRQRAALPGLPRGYTGVSVRAIVGASLGTGVLGLAVQDSRDQGGRDSAGPVAGLGRGRWEEGVVPASPAPPSPQAQRPSTPEQALGSLPLGLWRGLERLSLKMFPLICLFFRL